MAAEALLAEQPEPDPRGRRARDLRQRLPLHRLRVDHQRDPRRRRAAPRTLMGEEAPGWPCRPSRRPVVLTRHRQHARSSSAPTRSATSPAARSSSRTSTSARAAAPEDAPLRAPPRAASSTSTRPKAPRRLKGVVKVLTHEDVPNNWYTVLKLIGVELRRRAGAGRGPVLYLGEPIVAVVADERARRAARAPPRSRSTYEDLPAVFDVEEAIKPGRAGRQRAARHQLLRLRGPPLPAGPVRGRGGRASPRPTTSSSGAYESAPIEHAPTETDRAASSGPRRDGRLRIHPTPRRASSPSTTRR